MKLLGKVKTEVVVKHSFAGIHNWADCHIENVDFLKHPHRHIFHVTVKVPVTHDNRETEFFVLKNALDTAILNLYKSENDVGCFLLGSRSCEMIAKEIIAWLSSCKNAPKAMFCSVFEDDENGAEVSWSAS